MVTDPMVSIFDIKFDSLNTSCGKVSDEISFSKSSDFRDKEGSPIRIVVVPDKEEAIVTLPDKNFIQIINTSTMKAEQKILVPVHCYGITLIDNDIEQNFSILFYSINLVIVCITTI
jgi:hypothetical protein